MSKKNKNSEIEGELQPLSDMIVSESTEIESLDNNIDNYYSTNTYTNNNQKQNSSQKKIFEENSKTNVLRSRPNQNEINKKNFLKDIISNNVQSINSNSIKQNQKNIDKEKGKFFQNISIDKDNRIEINIPNIENKILFNKKKIILKYLILKKDINNKKTLKIYFEKYKKNTINIILNIIHQNTINRYRSQIITKENNNKIKELRIKKLKHLVIKKIHKNKEKLHIMFIKYYYSSLYIHLNWYIYVVNQLTYTQNLMNPNNNYNNYNNYYNNSNYYSNYNSEIQDPDPFRQSIIKVENTNNEHNSEVNNALRQSIMTIKRMNTHEEVNDALRESIMSINIINEALSNEAKQKKELEKKKHLKSIVLKHIKNRKNQFIQLFTKFFYKGKIVEQERTLEEEDDNNEDGDNKSTKLRAKRNPLKERRNKARNLRKLMLKKEKEKIETLRKYFYKFETNGVLMKLKKNVRAIYSSKNLKNNYLDDIKEEEEEKNNQIKEKQEIELTYLDKKRLEAEKEKKELYDKRQKLLNIIFYRKDRQLTIVKRKTIEKWNLRAKIFSLDGIREKYISKSVRLKKKKSKKKPIRSKTQGKIKN